MTPVAKAAALALAALNDDAGGLALLLTELPDDEVRDIAFLALTGLCGGTRAILTDAAMAEVIESMRQLAAQHAQEN